MRSEIVNQRPDRRKKKTEQMLSMIRSTLIDMMQDKKIADISVSDLTETVDISRSTFYLHYQDIFSVMEEIETIEIQRFKRFINEYTQINSRDAYLEFLTMIFYIFAENSHIYITLLGPNGDAAFLKKIRYFFRDNILGIYRTITPGLLPAYIDYSHSFYLGGLGALIETWISSGMKESAEVMAKIALSLVTFDIKQYLSSEDKLNLLIKN